MVNSRERERERVNGAQKLENKNLLNFGQKIFFMCPRHVKAKLFFVVLVFIFGIGFGAKASAATFYVDCNAADDSGVGTSESAAWKTINKVNTSSFSGDDQILFNRGCTWREQLTVPSSGTSGHPITFGAYGNSGDPKPVISGADIASGWVADSGSPTLQDTFGTGINGNIGLAATGKGWAAGKIVPTANYTLVQIGVGLQKQVGSAFTNPVSAYIYNDNSGKPGTVIATAVSTIQPALTSSNTFYNFTFSSVALTSGTTYWLVMNTAVDTNNYSKWNATSGFSGTLGYYGTNGITWTAYTSGYQPDIKTYILSTPLSNVWKSNVAVAPNIVIFNGTVGTKVTTPSLVIAPNEWAWSSGVLYAYSTVDPTNTIEYGARNYNATWNAKSYLTFDSLDFKYGNLYNLYPLGVSTAGVTIENSTIEGAYEHGFNKFGTTVLSNYVFNNNIVKFNGSIGIAINGNSSNVSIINNIVYNNGYTYEPGGVENTYGAGIKIVSDTTAACGPHIIENNDVYYNGYKDNGVTRVYANPNKGMGIWTDLVGTSGNSVQYNNVHDNADIGIYVEKSHDQNIFYNLSYRNGLDGISVSDSDGIGTSHTFNNVVYNNTAYGNTRAGLSVVGDYNQADVNVYNNTFKNNISVSNTGPELLAQWGGENDSWRGTGNVYLNNSFGPVHTSFVQWAPDGSGVGGYQNTYTGWEVNYCGSAGCSSSVQADPKLTSSSDFHLQSTSPAINAGTPVGLTTDYEGNPVPSGLLPDIGAYEYQDVSAPVGGSFAINSNASATNSTSATLTITCPTDSWTPVQMAYGDSLNPTNWETCAASKAWTLPTGDGTKTVHMLFKDGGGNTTGDITDNIILDTTGPTGSINNDSGDPTNDPTPTFNLTIADAGVGTASAQMRFSGNNSTWSSWESYAGTKTNFNINTGEGCANSDGTKKIYVQFKDSLGNVGLAYNTGNFTLDTTASNAALSNTPATHGIYTSSTSANITVGGTDVISYKYKLDSGSYGDETLIATHLTLSDLAEGSHTLSVIGKDLVGNWQSESDATSYTWTIDTHAPERSDKAPSGELPSGTTSATLTLTTGEVVTCKYDTISKDYGDMDNSFTTPDGLSHSATVSGLTGGISYNYYVRCQDTAENANDDDYLISFSVAASTDENTDNNTDDEKDLNIHNVKTESTENTITITWKTNHNTKSTVRYGMDKNLKEKKKDNDKEKKHQVVLKDLSPNTKYYFRINATDGDDNEDSSSIHSIMTKSVQTSTSTSNQDQGENTNQTSTKNTTTPPTYSGTANPNTCNYTVASGDTLWTIAKKVYGDAIAYPQIIEKNKDKFPDIETKLSIGQELTFCDSNQASQNTQNNSISENSNQQTQNQTKTSPQPKAKTFHWWNPFTWF